MARGRNERPHLHRDPRSRLRAFRRSKGLRSACNDALVTDGPWRAPELERLRSAPLTYPEIGLTRANMPSGYHHVGRTVSVGNGLDRFNEVAETLLGWRMHRGAGVLVRASAEPLVEGTVAVLRLGWGPVGVNAPVRVVYVVDEGDRKGFAYGTLPGDPESGEEAFMVDLRDDGRVTFTISAFSRPASMLARLGGPLSRGVQRWMTDRYLRARSEQGFAFSMSAAAISAAMPMSGSASSNPERRASWRCHPPCHSRFIEGLAGSNAGSGYASVGGRRFLSSSARTPTSSGSSRPFEWRRQW